ncbi:MAG: tetratricopeptide repeat protein [Oligoflexia bacterium]|nr:tetratricopeptide repeat protein [Oligoflexia bacterium]
MKTFIFVILFSINAHAFAPPTIEKNNEGVRRYQAEEYQEAFKNFAGALAKDPFNPYYHFNLGDAFLKGGEIPKAMAEFEAVEANPKADQELKFQAMFNAGNAAVEAKDVSKALTYYQKALSYKPDSVETKTNIELAIKEQDKKGSGGQQDQKDQKGGEGEKNDKQQQQQDGNKDDKKDEKKEEKNGQGKGPEPTPRPTPQGFKSQDLNEGEVRQILEELKNQEEKIRAKQYKDNKPRKEQGVEKDW